MSLVTTCPECQIRFIVRPEHLSAQGGKVRCGKCKHVFNAIEHLQEPNAVEVPIAPSTTSAQAASTEPRVVEAIEEAPIEFPFKSSEATNQQEIPMTEVLELSFETDIESSPTSTPESPSAADTASNAPDLTEPNTSALASVDTNPAGISDALESTDTSAKPALKLESAIAEALKPVSISLESEPAPVTLDAATTIDEILPPLAPTSTKRKSPKKEGKARSYTWLWAVLSLLLIVAAVGQTAYFMRSRLAVLLPPIKPYLELACAYAHCTIPLPKDMQLLVIDDSDLHEDAEHDGILHLTSTLINNAPYAQAYPNIELSLTNENDTPVLRRIFTPAEYLDSQVNPANGMLGGDETHINLALHVTDTAVSGYRVYLTYH